MVELALQARDKLDLKLVELGGWADVLAVEACPATGPPPGAGCQVVTGRYVHSSGDTLNLRIAALGDDSEDTIGVTAVHPFWSEDRQAFIAAGELKPSELLLTAAGDLTEVISLTPRPHAEPVYNLEVNTEHVYYVSNAGVLVHNACPKGSRPTAPSKPTAAEIKRRAKENHHYATNKHKTYTPKMAAIANRYNLKLSGKWNKDLLPHRGRHPHEYHDWVLRAMRRAEASAGGDVGKFKAAFNRNVKAKVRKNPELLRKAGWE